MANTTNFNWETPDDTDLVKDGALAIRTLGNSIDTSFVDLKGGTTGQILSKASNTDLDYTWINNDQGDITAVNVSSPITGGGTSGAVTVGIQDGTTTQKGAVQLENSISSTSTTTAAVPASVKSAYDLANGAIPKSLVDAAGDLIYATANDTVARLGIGTAGQVLKVNSGGTAPEWGAGGGKVLQVVSATKTDTFTSNSTTAVDITDLSVTITPSATSSKILLMVTVNGNGQNGSNGAMFVLLRGATQIAYPSSPGSRSAGFGSIYINDVAQIGSTGITHLDSPSSTSALTYKVQGFCTSNGNFAVNRSFTDTNNNSYVRTVSSITAIEIGA